MIVNEISLVIQNIKIEFQLYKCQPLDKRNKNERASQHKVGEDSQEINVMLCLSKTKKSCI